MFDASLVRDVEACKKGPVNCVALNKTGEHFLSVGHDQIVKVRYRISVENATTFSLKITLLF